MTIKNFTDEVVTNLEGKAVQESLVVIGEDEKQVPVTRDLTIKNAIVGALQNQLKGDETATVKQLFNNVALADRIYKGGEVSLESEDITNIKERVAKAWPKPIVLYRIVQFLER